MNNKQLENAQDEFSPWLSKNCPQVQATSIRKNSSGVLSLCVHHSADLGPTGKKKIAIELGDIPLMFEACDDVNKIKNAWRVKKIAGV